MRSCCLAVFSLALLWLPGCETPATQPSGKGRARLEADLARREQRLEAARGKLLDVAKRVDPKAEDVPAPLKEFVGVDKMKAEIQKIRDAVARLVVTSEDVVGLNAYCEGHSEEARERFAASDAKKPNREFPVYFLGAAALQDGEYAQARELFSKVVARNPQCRSAFLLRRLAALCEGRRDMTTVQRVLRFEQACRETLKELGLERQAQEPSVAQAFVPPLASDPVLFKAQELVGDIARRNFWEIAADVADADTAEKKLGLVLLMGDNLLADALIQDLALTHPADRDVRTFAFLHRYYARSLPKEGKARDAFLADLAALQELDKENGALALLAIPSGAAVGLPDRASSSPSRLGKPAVAQQKEAPLAEEELGLLRKGARAKEFHTLAAYQRAERLKGYLACYGGLVAYVPMAKVPSIYGHLAGVARRAAAAATELFEQGKADDALRLCSDLEAIATRAHEEAKTARSLLLADAILDCLHGAMQSYAAKADRKPLLKTCVERRATIVRHKAERLVAWDLYLVTLFRIPVRSLAEAAMQLEESPDLIRDVAAQKLKADPAKYYQQAMARLAAITDDNVPADAYEHLVILGDLKNRNAVPLLIRLAGHPDPLLAHLATRAFSAIAEAKE
jgi:hypothetical protein